MGRRKGIVCPRCKTIKRATVHHILPKCHYGETGEHDNICKYCHRIYESILLLFEGRINNKRKKLPKWFYRITWRIFLKTG